MSLIREETRIKKKKYAEIPVRPKIDTIDSELSVNVINLLLDKGFSKEQIASFLGKDKDVPFIEQVINKKKNLQKEDLDKLEKGTDLPILLLLLRSLDTKKLPSKNKGFFKRFHAIAKETLKSTSKLRKILRTHHY